eukprot:TRINITY_DN14058_c2_g2_i1.p1 TRINITY_DN14058_c2_g2~~TRINITY_DN14058_c2_g2_i1.p1  ORF type:complete len:184 (+),score=53.99 TRINITY_DN14058_c2_g2_i1:239-790(+)
MKVFLISLICGVVVASHVTLLAFYGGDSEIVKNNPMAKELVEWTLEQQMTVPIIFNMFLGMGMLLFLGENLIVLWMILSVVYRIINNILLSKNTLRMVMIGGIVYTLLSTIYPKDSFPEAIQKAIDDSKISKFLAPLYALFYKIWKSRVEDSFFGRVLKLQVSAIVNISRDLFFGGVQKAVQQ